MQGFAQSLKQSRIVGRGRAIILLALFSISALGAQPADGRVTRLRAAIDSVRFVAYTPTDLTIVSGEVHAATKQRIRQDLKILRRDFPGLVMYSCASGLENVPAIASELGYRALILGIWDPLSEEEIANAVRLARAYPQMVVGVAVGNETLLAKRHDWKTLRASIQRLRAKLPNTAIATSEPFYFYLNNDPPDFVELQDYLFPSVHPLYETWFPQATTEQAVDFVVQVANRLSAQTDKPLLIKETGLPSGPSARGFTPARQAEFWGALSLRMPNAPGRGLVYFEAFDHAWKVENAREEFGFQPEEAYWGFYTETGQPKPVVRALQGIWRTQNNPHSQFDTRREPALRAQGGRP